VAKNSHRRPLILAFVEADFSKRGMNLALAMVQNPNTKPDDLRVVIDMSESYCGAAVIDRGPVMPI
jgi:hypothetical protein